MKVSHYSNSLMICAVVQALFAPCLLHAVGFRLPNQDPVAIARGNAFTATADNPSALYYNPAGITQLEGHHAQLGLYAITVDSSYRSPTGRKSDTEFEIQTAPQLYYTFSPDESPFSFGFGAYAPYGLGLQWPQSSGFRTLTIEGRLAYVALNPVAAWQIHPKLSLAVGPTLNVGRIEFRSGTTNAFAPGDEFKFKGDGAGVGYKAGLLWQPHEQWSFGVSYHSATDFTFDGDSNIKPSPILQDTSTGIDFPQFVMAGVSYRPTKNWNIEFDIDWTDWDVFNAVTFKTPSGATLSRLPLNFKSSFMYSLGVTRYLNQGYFASAGYFFAENSVPDRNFNPAVPDTDQHSFSLGFGKKGASWDWALTYQCLAGPWRTVSNSQSTSLIRQSADGRYRFFNHAVNVSIGYHF